MTQIFWGNSSRTPGGVPPEEFPRRTGSVASAKAQLDWSCAYKAKAGILQDETVWANAAKVPPEAWHEMYVPGQVTQVDAL